MLRNRMRLRKGPLPFKRVLFYSFLILIGATIFSFWVVDRKIQPILENIANSEIRDIADEAVNEAISKNIDQIDSEKLLLIQQPKGSKPVYTPNDKMFSKVLVNITNSIHSRMKDAQHGTKDRTGKRLNSVVYHIPLGAVFHNALLSDTGPTIPVEMNVIGNVESELETITKNIGINNPSIEVYVKIKIHVQIVIPFSSKKMTIENKVKLGHFLIPQDVPDYYGGESFFQPAVPRSSKGK